MSLKQDYLTGPSGLEQNVAEAFASGIAFVGTGAADIESLSLGDRNGTNLSAGSAQPGIYFQIYGPSGGYTVWFSVNGEVAPSSLGLTLIPVTLLLADTSAQVAAKIAAALIAIPTLDFSAITVGNSIETTTSQPKAVNPLLLGPSGWGTAVAAVVEAGVSPTGNYAVISTALKNFAQMGRTEFKMYLPANCSPNSNILRANHGHNLILKAYFAGIEYAFAGQQIYNYEIKCRLNVSDKGITAVELLFNFSYNQKTHHELSYEIPPYRQPFEQD